MAKTRGIYFNEPRAGAPDFVDGDINIRVDEFIEYLKEQKSDYVKLDILKGDYGRYFKLNTFKPNKDNPSHNDMAERNSSQKSSSEPADNYVDPSSEVPF